MSRKRIFWTTFILVVLIGVGGLAYQALSSRNTAVPAAGSRASSVPTLFLHGYGGTANSTNHLIQAAEQRAGATKVLTATVTGQGHVQLAGNWPKNAKRPLVQVIFSKNKLANYQVTSQWLKAVLVQLKNRYHITRFNAVAHSMGNMALLRYELNHGQDHHLPQLQRQVDIAGHFDGILGMDDKANRNRLAANGRPRIWDANYKQFYADRLGYPDHQVRVLNIYGNLEDGTNSDGRVSNVSSRSLRYLIGQRALSYQEKEIKGKQAQHSRLHENSQVDQLIAHFLWGV